jgi:predicted lipid-binding transport protein (Tim44 family)
MHRSSYLLAAVAALALALAPSLADARAGSSGSIGSRGTNTYSAPPATSTAPYSAAPMQRSLTSPSTPAPGVGTPGIAPRPSFMSGMMGGLLGAGLIGMMFGGGMFGHGFGGFLGFLIQIALVVWLVRFLIRRFVRPSMPATASGPAMFAPMGPAPRMLSGGGGSVQTPVAIVPADYQAFEQLLKSIQAAWSVQDINTLRGLVTPEMLSYFAEQLAEQASRGVRNSVGDVHLLQGDLAEAWAEPGREYATVAMKFSMTDVTADAAGRIVDGSPTEHITATEIWTFLRSPGGHWILSAIQQAR